LLNKYTSRIEPKVLRHHELLLIIRTRIKTDLFVVADNRLPLTTKAVMNSEAVLPTW